MERDKCATNFPHGLCTLREASANPDLVEMWGGRLPEVTREATPSPLNVAGHVLGLPYSQIDRILVREDSLPCLDQRTKREWIGKSLWQVSLHPSQLVDGKIYSIFNIELEDMQPPDSFDAQLQHPQTGLSGNISPPGTFTDARVGMVNITLKQY